VNECKPLLRGRAAQNQMFEGKERRIELIEELQLEAAEAAAGAATDVAVAAGAAAIDMFKTLVTSDADERLRLFAASDVAIRRAEERELDAAAARIQSVAGAYTRPLSSST